MIWYKSWLESRTKLLWCSVFLLSAAWFFLSSTPEIMQAAGHPEGLSRLLSTLHVEPIKRPGASADPRLLAWQLYQGFAVFFELAVALMLAGSGINTQTTYGVRQGTHPSMIYTLSLPVPRGRWLAVRASLGAVEMLGCVVAIVFVPGLLAPLAGVPASWKEPLISLPFVCLGCLVFYSLSVLLSTLVDEMWQAMLGLGTLAVFSVVVLSGRAPALDLFSLMGAAETIGAGRLPWLGIVASLLAIAGLLTASQRIVSRREY